MKAGEIYKVEIGFDGERQCEQCPLKGEEEYTCRAKKLGDDYLHFESWEVIIATCPLIFVREVHC